MNQLILAAWSLAAAFAAGALHSAPTLAGEPADLGPSIEAALPRLDAIAENLITTGAIPGLSIAIVHNDQLIARLQTLSDPSQLRATLAEFDTVLVE